jgi:hypothetical protein
MFDDEDEDEDSLDVNSYLRKQEEIIQRENKNRNVKDFIAGCYEAYELLVTDGSGTLEASTPEAIGEAVNRMTTLFLRGEEYERCNFLKNYIQKYIPNHKIEIVQAVNDDLNEYERNGDQ